MKNNGGRTGPVVALGEVLLRLSPPARGQLRQTSELVVDVGGAEANVLAALSALGRETRLLTALPASPLGDLARAALDSRGIETRHVVSGDGRMGLYFFENGQGRRASRIVYDRAGSTFANAAPDQFDLDTALNGASLLHLSGITPALGQGPAALALAAAQLANARGVTVCFDGNFRAQLWEAREVDPRPILTDLIELADILIGNHRDIALVTGKTFSGDGAARREQAVATAFAEFPRLQMIASTARNVVDSDRHGVSARVDTRDQGWQSEELVVDGIVDRIGTGDAFAAGVLDGWLDGECCEGITHRGLALNVLKHTVAGDVAQFDRAEVDAFWNGERDVRR